MRLINSKNLQNQNTRKKAKKALIFENFIRLLKEKQEFLNDFESKIFPIGKETHRERPKILTPKHMLKRLPIAIAGTKDGNTSENLRNEVRQIMHSFYQAK